MPGAPSRRINLWSRVSRAVPVWAAVLLALALTMPAIAQELPGGEGGAGAAGRTAAEGAGDAEGMDEAQRLAEQALAAEPPAEAAPVAPSLAKVPSMNLLELAVAGGPLMVPILLMSIVLVLFAFERWVGLRRRKTIPPALVKGLGELSSRQGGLDPRQAYRLCQQYPSAAANVFRSVLLKVGRPHSEVEHTMVEASEREAARLYKNVRPIELAITVTPLLGLLGTVQGMIQAFYVTANMPTNVNKAENLANGIYVALVTTFAGLSVAIPAAVLAHYFEGRIQSLFRDVDEFLVGLLPQLERFEGKLRVHRHGPAGVSQAELESVQPPAEKVEETGPSRVGSAEGVN
jgi:biopolymer transport protein ExbB